MNGELDNSETGLGETNLLATVSYEVKLPLAKNQRYVAKRFHAHGGMGEVWLAFDQVIGREVALKRIRAKHSEQELRFLAEAQIAGQLEHPSIVPVHDLGQGEDGLPFYIMKFVHGQTLTKVLQEFHASDGVGSSDWHVCWRRILDVFVDLCEAVAYAHSRGVIHRDLKPDNVMVGSFGETMVIDWGLAKVLHQAEIPGTPCRLTVASSGHASETHAGSVIGSPLYMPPEMAEGHADEAGPATDVYLLGATLYSILTGEPPRRGSSHDEIVELARSMPPVPPRQRKKWIPRALEAVCVKAMAMRIENRYASATDMANDVRRFLAGTPVDAYPEGIAARSVRYIRRHWRGALAVFASCTILALVLFSALLSIREKARVELSAFHSLTEDAHYWLANTNPAGEAAPYYDVEQGQQVARKALQVNHRWANWLKRLPLVSTEEHDRVNTEVHELLLLLVQSRIPTARTQQEQRDLLEMLEQAKKLAPPSRIVFELEMALQESIGDSAAAARSARYANDPQISTSALDHFLLGEQHRLYTARTAASDSLVNTEEDSQEVTHAHLRAAIVEYGTALTLDPNHFWCRFQLGRCHLALGENSLALASLRACLALRPDSLWGRSTFGFALSLVGQPNSAIEELNRVVKSDASFLPARLNRAVALLRKNETSSALEDLDAVLLAPLDKRLLEAAYYRAQIRIEAANLPGALNDLDQLIEGKARFLPAYLLRAKAHFLNSDPTRGLADLDRFLASQTPAVESESAFRRGWHLLRLALQIKPKTIRDQVLELARADLVNAVGSMDKPNVHAELAEVLRRLRQDNNAIAQCSKGLDRFPNDLRLLRIRGQIYFSQKQIQKAEDDFRLAAQCKPTTNFEVVKVADSHARLGHILALNKNRSDAESQVAQALAILQTSDADNYILKHNLACIYGELANWDVENIVDHRRTALQLIAGSLRGAAYKNKKAREQAAMRTESAFESLRELPEFVQLLND